MANAFRPWIDDANVSASNVQDGATFVADTQRESGFAAGVPASSIRVNTALREATLVATALVNLLGNASANFDAQTTSITMEEAFAAYFGQDVVGLNYNIPTQSVIVYFKGGGSQSFYFPQGTVWYDGTDVVYNSLDDYYSISKSSYPNLHIGDYYFITENYDSNGKKIKKGDLFKVVYDNPASGELQFVANIAGADATASGHTFTVKEENAIGMAIVAHKTDGSYEFYTSDSFTKVFNNVEYLEFVHYGGGTARTNKEMCIVDDTGGTITNVNITTFSMIASHKYTVYCNDDITLTF